MILGKGLFVNAENGILNLPSAINWSEHDHWSVWKIPGVFFTVIVFIVPPNPAHLRRLAPPNLGHLRRTTHLDNFELQATLTILKSSLKTSKHQDPCFEHCQRGFHRFSDPCQLSLELAMRNVILWRIMNRRNKTKWIYLHDKEKKKLFCFCYKFSKTLQVLKMETT